MQHSICTISSMVCTMITTAMKMNPMTTIDQAQEVRNTEARTGVRMVDKVKVKGIVVVDIHSHTIRVIMVIIAKIKALVTEDMEISIRSSMTRGLGMTTMICGESRTLWAGFELGPLDSWIGLHRDGVSYNEAKGSQRVNH